MAYGNIISSAWRTYISIYNVTSDGENTTIWFTYGVDLQKKLDDKFQYKFNSSNWSIPTSGYCVAKGWHQLGSSYLTYSRDHNAKTIQFSFWLYHGGSGAKWKGTSTATEYYTIPARESYTISYALNSPNTATGSVPSNQTKYYNEATNLSSDTARLYDNRYSFASWNTKADGTGTSYTPKASISKYYNQPLALYAQWNADFPPTLTTDDAEATVHNSGGSAILGFSGIKVECNNITTYNDGTYEKEIYSMELVIGSTTVATKTTGFSGTKDSNGNTHYSGVTMTADANDLSSLSSGTYPVYIVITDDKNKSQQIPAGSITIVDPTWKKEVEVQTLPPQIVNGNAVLDAVYVWNYSLPTPAYELVSGTFPATVVRDDPDDPDGLLWTFTYVFDADHVSDPTDDEPNINVKVEFKQYTSYEKPYRQAFFNTTRNQNFSNGIYNVMFIGGVENNPNYTSRVWWSQINNPLYFPDTNYIEVGSNDTAVMGLTKVGDYLAVIKQSKTTDTAIFLVYPTSFEEETTFAVRQGVQGVGAIGRYTFNILGDETLFLSPKGIMAIAPSQDEEHKVLNRSYFIDGKLLKESNIDEAYSFVFDGKYWLAVNGVVYVLDGNQRNSWGNDKTNLVYECYYLDNVPARCFVKYNDKLVFSTYDEVCVVGDGYEDDYGFDDDGNQVPNAPVKAEWSTVFDDDGSLHYYKTMQKKGNLVSVLPMDIQEPYTKVIIDFQTYYEDPTKYYRLVNGKYVQCKEDSLYIIDETYYVANRSGTKVYIRKDDKEPVEIQRQFGLDSSTPSELFIGKKFKKYKRLQFIIKNELPEPFGIDEIVKNYTVGNYAKR